MLRVRHPLSSSLGGGGETGGLQGRQGVFHDVHQRGRPEDQRDTLDRRGEQETSRSCSVVRGARLGQHRSRAEDPSDAHAVSAALPAVSQPQPCEERRLVSRGDADVTGGRGYVRGEELAARRQQLAREVDATGDESVEEGERCREENRAVLQ